MGSAELPLKAQFHLKNIIIIGGSIMIFEIGVIVGGCVAHMILSGAEAHKKVTHKGINMSDCPKEKSNVEKTEDYFLSMPTEYQLRYVERNLDLKEYSYMFTGDKYQNARAAAYVASKTGKTFNNDNKVY